MRRWWETVEPRAAAKYVEMWGRENISEGVGGIKTPMLIIAAEKDAAVPICRVEYVYAALLPQRTSGLTR